MKSPRLKRFALPVALFLLLLGLIAVYAYPKYLRSRLIEAVQRGDVAAVRALLDKGADPNAVEPPREYPAAHGYPLLIVAMRSRKPEMVAALLEKGADANTMIRGRTTALMVAVTTRRADIVQLLLEHGADPNAEDDSGQTAAYITGKPEPDRACYDLLKRHGVRLSLIEAAMNDDMDEVSALLATGVDPNAQFAHGMSEANPGVFVGRETALYFAMRNRNPEIIRLLVAHGAKGRLHSPF